MNEIEKFICLSFLKLNFLPDPALMVSSAIGLDNRLFGKIVANKSFLLILSISLFVPLSFYLFPIPLSQKKMLPEILVVPAELSEAGEEDVALIDGVNQS